MTWKWKYEIGDRVRLNQNCKWAFPNLKIKTGIITKKLESKTYDYEVELEKNIHTVRVKENEINIIEE